MCPTGVESGETSLLNAAHTAGDTSQSTLRYFCRERSFCFSIGSFSSDGWRETLCKEKNNINLEEQEKCLRSCQPGEDPAKNSLHKSQTTQRLPAAGEPRRLQQRGERGGKGDPMQSTQQNSVSLRRKKPKELSSWNSRIQTHSSFGRWTSRVKFAPAPVFQQKEWCGTMKSIPPATGRQNLHDYFKISATGEALLDFNDLLRDHLKNDNVHGFDTKWDEVLLSMTKVPEEDTLEIVFKKTAPSLRGFETSHGLASAEYSSERITGQLFSIERTGSPSCGAEFYWRVDR